MFTKNDSIIFICIIKSHKFSLRFLAAIDCYKIIMQLSASLYRRSKNDFLNQPSTVEGFAEIGDVQSQTRTVEKNSKEICHEMELFKLYKRAGHNHIQILPPPNSGLTSRNTFR